MLLTIALLRAPEAEIAPGDRDGAASGARAVRFRLRDTVPRLSDLHRLLFVDGDPGR